MPVQHQQENVMGFRAENRVAMATLDYVTCIWQDRSAGDWSELSLMHLLLLLISCDVSRRPSPAAAI